MVQVVRAATKRGLYEEKVCRNMHPHDGFDYVEYFSVQPPFGILSIHQHLVQNCALIHT